MPTITRIADLDDRQISGLRAESAREGFKFIERLCNDWASGANRFDACGEALFVAIDEGQVVGVCGLNRDPYAKEPRTGRVRRLYVSPAHRGIGVGSALLEAVITHAAAYFDLLRVRTDAAHAFYTSHGFQPTESDGDATHILKLKPRGNASFTPR
jgi:GNAT superfamily N-acetyltransferase